MADTNGRRVSGGHPATPRRAPWRYELGMWLSSRGLTFIGHRLMYGEIARMTAHMSDMDRNILLRRVQREVMAEMEAARGKQ